MSEGSSNGCEKDVKERDKNSPDDRAHGDVKGEKRKSGSPLSTKVHSANDWEHADLGDDDRKNKFLKLMGAEKKSHSGKIVIGEKNPQHKTPAKEKLNEDLEDQYKHSMDHQLAGAKRHLGLGFSHEKTDSTPADGSKATEAPVVPPFDDDSKDSETLPLESEKEIQEERTHLDKQPLERGEQNNSKDKSKLHFVKGAN